ncbi:hypothetical protein ABW20_dc0106598 [Dactylellina cionopaga]|nr:hypothetical protein ABW20_dc0106598 [Dactylellina cionopaga]
MSELTPLSESECDRQAVRVFEEIKDSKVKFVIVHCSAGNIRSPATAAAIKMMVGPDKIVLLLEGGSQAFFSYASNPGAQREYYRQQEAQLEEERLTAFRNAQAAQLAAQNNPDILIIPETEGTPTRMTPHNSLLQNVSPTFQQLIMGQHPLEESDREETIRRDGAMFMKYYNDDPPKKTDNCKPGGPNNGGDGNMGGGGMGGGMGGAITKRSMNPLDIAGGRLRKSAFGYFRPEPNGKGMRIVKRM